ncbi:MAG: hypothetical protein WCL14_13920 [Bacteroidota bacterium]
MKEKKLFEEKQYLGYNKYAIMRQLVLAIFCFIAYQITDKSLRDIFFVIGMALLVISIMLLFILHMHITVYENSIIIDGLWTSRKVKIDINSIASIEKTVYSKYTLNNPVYNVHSNGVIKFYSGGHNEAVKITDRDGLIYLIGSQKSEIICNIVEDILNKKR